LIEIRPGVVVLFQHCLNHDSLDGIVFNEKDFGRLTVHHGSVAISD
jgi:hypothetical protein